MLTSKQKELLMFIHERLKETGVPPSFDEMKEALDLCQDVFLRVFRMLVQAGVMGLPAGEM